MLEHDEVVAAAAVGEEVGHHVVDVVVASMVRGAGGPALRRRHDPEAGAYRCQPILLRPVVEGVPLEIVGISSFGVASGHRYVEGR